MAKTSATGLNSLFSYHADLSPIRNTIAIKPYRKTKPNCINALIYFLGTVTRGVTFPVS